MKRWFCLFMCAVMFSGFLTAGAVGTSAKAAILINGDTGVVLFEQNADERLPMASTTKIMTAFLLCEHGNLDREITVTAEMLRVEGSSMGLLAGDKVTLHDLLYGMMLASGNDAANVTAYTLGGTVNGFVAKMNRKAEELGLKNTHFVTPSGLDAEDHFTTASDLARLAMTAMQNPDFAAAVSAKSATLCYGNPPYKRTLTNHNRLLNCFEGAVGVKTGFTKKSGRCLVSAAKRDGKLVIAVTLHDPNDWADHKSLLEYGFQQTQTVTVTPEQQQYVLPVVSSGGQSLTVSLPEKTFTATGQDGFSVAVFLPHFVYAPVAAGEQIGSAVYQKNGAVIYELPIRAQQAVPAKPKKQNGTQKCWDSFRSIFLKIWES